MKTVSPNELRAFISSVSFQKEPVSRSLEQCTGRVLAENIYADRDFPPFDRVAMDGYAIRYEIYAKGGRAFQIIGSRMAGSSGEQFDISPESTIKVMTGGVLPEGMDTIVPWEHVQVDGDSILIQQSVKSGQNVHRQGLDRKGGDRILHAGAILSAADLAIAATVGKTHLLVRAVPSVHIICTGDELVEVHEDPAAHQIRASNPITGTSIFSQIPGCICTSICLPDTEHLLHLAFQDAIQSADCILMVGGSSGGDKDFTRTVFEQNDVSIFSHRVTQRPGQPLIAGVNKGGALCLGIPGNPVSATMCMLVYAATWIREKVGLPILKYQARLATTIKPMEKLDWFCTGNLEIDQTGTCVFHPLPVSGSGDLAHLANTNSFGEIPNAASNQDALNEQNQYPAGMLITVWNYR